MKLKHITIHYAMKKRIHLFKASILLAAFCCFSILLPNQVSANNTFMLTASNESAAAGATICVDITTKNFTGIVGLQYDMSFDESLFQFQEITSINSEVVNLAYNEMSPGLVRVVWSDIVGNGVSLTDGSLLYSMCFIAQGNSGDVSPVSFETNTPIEVITATPGWVGLVPWALIDGSIGIGSAAVTDMSLDDACANAVFCGGGDGNISITPSGGQTPYSFLWTGPGGFTSTTMNLTGLPAGIYSLTMTDANGLELTANMIIEITELEIAGQVTDPACGQTNGSIEILFVFGGTAPYSYLWSNGSTTANLVDVPVGEYEVTVTDANGCEGSAFYTIEEEEFGDVTAIVDDPACGGGLGSIDITVTGGMLPYSYYWNTGEADEDIDNLSLGIYTVTITDAAGCTMERSYSIGMISNQFNYTYVCDPMTDLAELFVVDWLQNEENTYEWSTGEITVDSVISSINNLPSGTYSVTVTGNSSGCSTVVGPINIDCTTTQSPNNCLTLNAVSVSGNSGEQICMDITANGFTSIQGVQYTVSWDPTVLAYSNTQNYNLPNLSSLNFGESQTAEGHLLTSWFANAVDGESVSDGTAIYQICFDLIGATGTSSSVSFTEDPLAFEVVAAVNTVIGLNASNGSVTIGGPAQTLHVTNLCGTAPGCIDLNTGSVDIIVEGGTAPYSFTWFNEAGTAISTTEDLGGITEEGTYSVVVTDANGEEATALANIIINAPEVAVVSVTDVNCNGGVGGSIDLSISGGTLPYSFAWSNGATTEDVDNLAAGEYQVTVSDQQGCMTIVAVTVVQASDLMVEGETTCPSEAGGDGSIDITVSGGVIPYLYTWSNGMLTEDISGLENGAYVITVEDAAGCIEFISFYIGDCVWPGDTDTNGIVNNFDLLNIGLAYGATGSVRPNASINWTPQKADNWTESTPISLTNYKHIDTNGEGLIDDNDTLAISQNWGSTHNFMDPPTDGFTVNAPFYVQPDTFIINTTVGLPVILGDMGNPIDELYGVAFSVTYDPEVVVPGTAKMTFENSWVGELNNDMITIQRTFHAAGRVDVAMVRNDGMNVIDGLGQISTFFITIEDDLVEPPGFTGAVDGMETVFGIENVRIITNIEEEVLVTPTATTSTIEGVSSGVNDFEENFDLQLFPNPVSDQLTINSTDAWIEQVTVFDVASREIVSYNFAQAREAVLETNQLGAGTYVVKIQTDKGLAVRRIVVMQ